jgi:hypothetical protein
MFQNESYNDIPRVTVWRVLRKRLHLKAYKLSNVQHLERSIVCMPSSVNTVIFAIRFKSLFEISCISQHARRLCGRSERCKYAVDAEDELAFRPPCFTAFSPPPQPLHHTRQPERAANRGPARMSSFVHRRRVSSQTKDCHNSRNMGEMLVSDAKSIAHFYAAGRGRTNPGAPKNNSRARWSTTLLGAETQRRVPHRKETSHS